jgi:hypothetical protein
MELPAPAPDGRIYLNTSQAAELLNVAACTISAWKNRGHLTPLAGSPPRKPLYLYDDLIKAEFTAWQNALRTSGSDKRVKRRSGGKADAAETGI